ncbi:MAG: glycosyltransferase [Proteobacteria bacterium]|nr:glycosyltransferase [Pseudomonadota bacterium]
MHIAVVTPSFNQAPFLEQALASVAQELCAGDEHVVFDGGSSDGSLAILQRWATRIRYVSAPDGGQADAVNQGLRATTGDVVGWLNSDDFFYPGAFDAVRAAFAAHPDIDVVYGHADHVDIDGHPYEPYPTESFDFQRLTQTCFICQPALFFRRRVIDQVGLLDVSLRYCLDYEYWLRLALAGRTFLYIDARLAASRMYPTNKTLGSRVAVHEEIVAMLRRRLGRVPDRWLFNYGHAVADSRVDRNLHPWRYGRCMVRASLAAALRYNGRISSAMRAQVFAWMRSGARRRLRGSAPSA